MKPVRGPLIICMLAAALLVAGCSVKLPASTFPGFRLTPPAEPPPENVDATSRDNEPEVQP